MTSQQQGSHVILPIVDINATEKHLTWLRAKWTGHSLCWSVPGAQLCNKQLEMSLNVLHGRVYQRSDHSRRALLQQVRLGMAQDSRYRKPGIGAVRMVSCSACFWDITGCVEIVLTWRVL